MGIINLLTLFYLGQFINTKQYLFLLREREQQFAIAKSSTHSDEESHAHPETDDDAMRHVTEEMSQDRPLINA